MGKVNDYIEKMLKYLKIEIKDNKEKPWLKYYKNVPESLNYYQGSMYDYLKESVIRNEKRTAYSYYGVSVSYKGFLKRIDKIAKALTQFNIVENECVTICMPNTPESIALIYAINKIGAIANIIHPLSSTKDIKRALDETNSTVLFCSDTSMPNAKKIKVKHFILVPNSNSLIKVKKIIYNLKESTNLKLEGNMISWSDFISY